MRGFFLPENFRSSEIAQDKTYTISVGEGAIATGDILGFSRAGETDVRRVHIGIARRIAQAEIDVVHNAKLIGKVTFWPLVEFQRYDAYEVLRFIKRPIREVPELLLPHLPDFGLR